VHTSTKTHLTSATIRIQICIQICDPDRHQNLTISSLAHCQPSLKISCKSVCKFLRKVANRQTNRQTNDDDYISSLAEVIILYAGDIQINYFTLSNSTMPDIIINAGTRHIDNPNTFVTINFANVTSDVQLMFKVPVHTTWSTS